MAGCPRCDKELEQVMVADREYYLCVPCEVKFPKCEVYSRVVGYLRPTQQWNKGKVEEFEQRVPYSID